MTELIPDTERQASHIFRGYNYQAYQTILAWLKCGKNEEILTEFVEDVDLVRRDAENNITDAELTQIKNEKKRVTLNSKAARDLINNFFKHKKRNPDIILFMRLCTVSDRGKEKKCDWVYAENGLDLWDCIKSRRLSTTDQEIATGMLRSFFSKITAISKDALNFIQASNETLFLEEFVDRISWDTGQSSYTEIEKDIKQVLANLPRPINDPSEVKQTIYRLWHFVTHSIAGKSGQTLNRTALEAILLEETTAKIDRKKLNSLAADSARTATGVENIEKAFAAVIEQATRNIHDEAPIRVIERQNYESMSSLPPLPRPCADRSSELLEIKNALNDVCFLWIHGSTGYGKTTLANLYARQGSSIVSWFRLRNYFDFTLISVLQRIPMIVGDQLKAGYIIILDDLANIEQQTQAIELVLNIFDYVKKSSSRIIITSQYRIPSRLKLQIGNDCFEYVAPEMSEADINLLLNHSGLNDVKLIRFWSTYILASTSGHPQLVSAFAAYAKENRWTFTPEMLTQQPRSVNEVKTESRKLLAETIKNDEARALARYLSLVTGPFDREFALNVGNAAPEIKESGRALDTLVGPWIESLGNDIYSLSPLLRGYTEADAGKNALERYYVILCVAWLKKMTLTPFELVQAMIAALTAKIEPLIAKLCRIQFTTSSENFKILSKELYLIPHFYIDSDVQLTGIHPVTRFMFRYFQLKITENNEDWKSYQKIYLQIQQEINKLEPDSLEYKMCAWLFYIDTILRTSTPVTAKDRVLHALTIIEMVKNGSFTEVTSLLDFDKLGIDSLSMIATHNIDKSQELEFLLSELKKRPVNIVASFFNGFKEYPDNLSLMIDRVWLNESKKDAPDWDTCINIFSDVMEFARQHGNEWLFAGAARGIIVVYDEYLVDSTKALQMVDKARTLLGHSHPLIDIQESTVYFRSEEYERVIAIITNLEYSLAPEIIPILRVHALRRAIRSAGELKQWDKVAYFAERGVQTSQYLIVKGMGEFARIGFEAELGWSSHEKGNLGEALKLFESVLYKMERVSDQAYPLFNIFRLRFGSALAWLSNTWKMNGTVVQLKKSILKPFAGMFSNFEDPPEEVTEYTVQPYPFLWSHLAKYSASFADISFVDSIAKRATVRIDGKQFLLALVETYHAIYFNCLVNMEFDRALDAGREYAKLLTILPDYKTIMGERRKLNDLVDIDSYLQNRDQGFYDRWSQVLAASILEPMMMFICALDEQPKIDFSRWVDQFIDTFGQEDSSVKFVKWMEITIGASFEDSDLIEMISKDAWEASIASEQTRRMSILAMCVSPNIQLSETLSAQFSMLKNMMYPALGDSCWAIFFFKLIAKRWTYLVNNQKFLLRSPGIWSDKILDAIAVSAPTASDVAKLLMLIGEGTSITWPKEMLSELREISQ